MFLLDTNVVSELRKFGTRKINPQVEQWAKTIPGEQTYLSVVTIFELERGVLRVERRDAAQGKVLRQWLDSQVLQEYAKRVIPISVPIAQRCAQLHVPNPMPDYDAWIAATALEYGFTVITRNVDDFERIGVNLINPWRTEV